MLKINLNFETVGSICAMITSVIALFVAWEQTNLMQAQKDASVWPVITTDISINQNEQQSFVQFDIANVGVGPAIVRNGNLFIDDTVVTSYQDFKDKLLVGSLNESVSVVTSNLNGFVGAGDQKMILQLSWERNVKNDTAFMEMVNQFVAKGTKLRISQCYCSVFERCYQAGLGLNTGPQEVEFCELQKVDPVSMILESIKTD